MKFRIRLFTGILLAALAFVALIGAWSVWPTDESRALPTSLGQSDQRTSAQVKSVETNRCPGSITQEAECVVAKLSLGKEVGGIKETSISFTTGPGQPQLEIGDRILVGYAQDNSSVPVFYFVDFERSNVLIVLTAIFAVVVVLIGRLRGVGAIAGLVFTWLVIVIFVLPSIFEGNSPLIATLSGSAIIGFFALYVAHGPNMRTTVALIGTLSTLLLTAVIADVAVNLANLQGISSEEASYLQTYATRINLQGLLLGGIVIGSLGILNDVTVTQASSVWEIHRANPTLKWLDIYKSGMRVGRDHIASTVYTIVLAYVGAALPLLMLFHFANSGWWQVASSSVVAEEIVRTLAGATGLVLSVPLTTFLAAITARGFDPTSNKNDEEPGDQTPPEKQDDDETAKQKFHFDIPESGQKGTASKETGDSAHGEPGLDDAVPIEKKPVDPSASATPPNARDLPITTEPPVRFNNAARDVNIDILVAPSQLPQGHSSHIDPEDTGLIRVVDLNEALSIEKRTFASRFGLKKSTQSYSGRKMTRRERKFWGDFAD